MSFRELRSFTEIMKSLGYPRMVSLDNFRTPNFELVADCLQFYPECSISDDISTEGDRVKFLQSIAQIALAKARMKLNLKKLYAADGTAVRELLKLAELLYKATQTANSNEEVEQGIQATLLGLSEGVNSLTSQLNDLAASETALAVRPAYMDEYEALQAQLQVLWLHYLERFRNLQYLEAQLEGYHKAEQDAAEAAEKRRRKMQRRLA
eukprot:gene12904-13030_t